MRQLFLLLLLLGLAIAQGNLHTALMLFLPSVLLLLLLMLLLLLLLLRLLLQGSSCMLVCWLDHSRVLWHTTYLPPTPYLTHQHRVFSR
jgi:hypothetical protein